MRHPSHPEKRTSRGIEVNRLPIAAGRSYRDGAESPLANQDVYVNVAAGLRLLMILPQTLPFAPLLLLPWADHARPRIVVSLVRLAWAGRSALPQERVFASERRLV